MSELTEKQKKKAEANRKFREKLRVAKQGQNGTHPPEVATPALETWADPDDSASTSRTWTKPTKKAAPGPLRGKRGPNKKTVEKRAKVEKVAKSSKMSQLGAAYEVLKGATENMTPTELVAEMKRRKLWDSPNGKTPDATLSAALVREITKKGAQSRFRKTAPGHYAAVAQPEPGVR